MLKHAMEVPARTIAENSAADGGVVVWDLRRGTGDHGFDAARGVYCNLVEAGIVDPTKVVRVALENAVSVAGTLLLTRPRSRRSRTIMRSGSIRSRPAR